MNTVITPPKPLAQETAAATPTVRTTTNCHARPIAITPLLHYVIPSAAWVQAHLLSDPWHRS